jgi:hypothetical protein
MNTFTATHRDRRAGRTAKSQAPITEGTAMSLEQSYLKGTRRRPESHVGAARSRRGAYRAARPSAVLLAAGAAGAAFGVMLLAVLVFSPAAGADATTAPPPVFSSASGLPDGRVYEEVSPPDKNGFNAGVKTENHELLPDWGVAAASGNSMMFWGNGPMGEESFSGLDTAFIASHTSGGGWHTRSATPRPYGEFPNSALRLLDYSLTWLYASDDLSHLVFSSYGAWVGPPDEIGHNVEIGKGPSLYGNSNIFLTGSNPSVPPTWLGQPSIAASAPANYQEPMPVGGTPDLSTVYFASRTPLLPADAARAANSGPWGFYEYRDGTLSEAGVLPDGSLNPYGAAPAAVANLDFHILRPGRHNNEVSADGSSAFFVSPDPIAATSTDTEPLDYCYYSPCTSEVPQLYVRKTAADGSQSSVLVSQSQLPGHVGQPAPDGPDLGYMQAGAPYGEANRYFYASSDGSHAFFTSVDRLTALAPENSEVKEYGFDVDTNVLTYIPHVAGGIVASAQDGSWLLFEDTTTSPTDLDLWVAGPEGGSVQPVAQLEGGEVSSVQVASDSSVVAFASSAAIAGFNNGGGGIQEVYRYDVPSNSLSCVSCPGAGATPMGASLSTVFEYPVGQEPGPNGNTTAINEPRDLSADGSRVFFQTPNALVPQDTNGVGDVYEWENGTVFLISSGTNNEPTQLLDGSETGDDLFFATAQGLAPGDTDGAFDVYDARVPRPGDNPPVAAVPCQGDVCQGPPSVASLLGAPASATYSGLGNAAAPAGVKPSAKPKRKATPRCAKGRKLSRGRCVKTKSQKKTKAKRIATNGRAK